MLSKHWQIELQNVPYHIEGLAEAGNLALKERSELRRVTIDIANLISSLDSDRLQF